MSEVQALELQIRDNAQEAVNGLDSLVSSLQRIKGAVGRGLNLGKAAEQLEKMTAALSANIPEENVAKLERIVTALERLKGLGKINMSGVTKALDSSGLQGAQDAIRQGAQAMDDTIKETQGHIEEMGNSAKTATNPLKDFLNGLKETTKGAKKTDGVLKTLASSFARIAMYRMLRTAVKELTDAFKFGIANVREYSKAIGSSFARDMEAANNATFKMKNSIGAALAPVLQSLIPILQTVTSWVITVVNAFNQLFSLLRGQSTWTRATDAAASSMDKVKNSAGGASKEIKNLLADWDELNIIQSESGGGGGGGGGYKPIDYESMFEEVDVFDQRIRNIVKWIKDHMDQILSIAKKIGLALLAWNVSNALTGVLATLAGLVAAGLVAGITWDLVIMFDTEYLKTGEPGWLIADVLTTAIGSYFAYSILEKVLGHGSGEVAAAITILVSALASVKALIDETDVSALSQESLALALETALKGGVGIALGAHKIFNMTGGDAALVGVAATGLVFGATIGIKAIAESIQTGETAETLGAKAISSLSMGAGAYGIFKTMGFFGNNLIKGAGGASLVTLGATIGISAVVEAVESGITLENLAEIALSALGIGVGAGLLATMVGAGATTAAVAGLIAGGSVIAIAAAAIGIAAYIKSKPESVQWGDVSLTEKEVQAFVEQKMFDVDAQANIKLVKATVSANDAVLDSLTSDIAATVPKQNVVRLGLADEDTYNDLIKQFFGEDGNGGVMGKIKEYCKTQTNVIETGISMVPVINEAGEDQSAQFLQSGITGWADVEQYMLGLGSQLSELLKKGAKDGLNDFDQKLVDELLDKINSATQAITSAQIGGRAAAELQIGLGDLDEKSFENVVSLFGDYKNQLKEAYTESRYQAAESFGALAEYYRLRGNTELADKYSGMYHQLIDNITQEVNDAVEKASKLGKEEVVNAINKFYGDAFLQVADDFKNDKSYNVLFDTIWGNVLNEEGPQAAMRAFLNQYTGISEKALEAIDSSGWELLPKEIQGELKKAWSDAFGQDFADAFVYALENGLQEIGDYTPKIPETVVPPVEEAVYGATEPVQVEVPIEPVPEVEKPAEQEVKAVFKPARDELYKTINDYILTDDSFATGNSPAEFWQNVLGPMVSERAEAAGLTAEAVDSVSSMFYEKWLESLFDEDWEGSTTGLINILDEAIEEAIPADFKPIDDTALVTGLDTTATRVETAVNRITAALTSMNGMSFSFAGGLFGGMLNIAMPKVAAEGGTFATGDMFIAREAGPEMVGRIGSKTTVANNDQIVSGISSGVAAGQEEQNALLRRQNDLLTRLLNKKFIAEAVPSAAWGKNNRRSEEMYSRNVGG